jgi:uncharacterized protein (TIGR00369 family)
MQSTTQGEGSYLMAIAKMTATEFNDFLHKEFPQAFEGGDICIESADGNTSLLRQRYSERMLRPGRTVSGPTLMALADLAMYVVLLSAIGPIGLAVTTNLSINFLRKGEPGKDVFAAARLLKLGRRLAVGEVNLSSGDSPDLIAHVTATYSIPKT